jgi:CrcB protein
MPPGGWPILALVMAGGALGAAGRWWLGAALSQRFAEGAGLPWGTLAANLGGAFLAGLIAALLVDRGEGALAWRAFVLVGLLGGFTTYSALMVETLLLWRDDRALALAGYLGLTLAGGLALVAVGAWIGRQLATP